MTYRFNDLQTYRLILTYRLKQTRKLYRLYFSYILYRLIDLQIIDLQTLETYIDIDLQTYGLIQTLQTYIDI